MMNYIAQQFLNLAKQLFPKGRAYWIPTGSAVETLVKTFNGNGSNQVGTLERVYSDANSVLDHIIPDNPNFTDGTVDPLDNDCNDGERRWGLVQYGITSISTPTRLQRMAALNQKMSRSDAPRQSASYLQSCLQAAGFNVYVYENLSNKSPDDILGPPSGAANLGDFDLGESDLGEYYTGTIIANKVDEVIDSEFVIPDPNFHGTFFISGSPITTFANVPIIQKTQFRQLILNLKPAHMIGFLFVNYT